MWNVCQPWMLYHVHVELYNVLWSLYNIKHPCKNLPDLWKPPDLWTIICSYRIADIVEHWTAMVKITRRVDFYKYLWSLYNIKQPCRNHQTRAPYTLSTVQVRPCIRRSALEKFTSRVDFIRCQRLCIIFTHLAETTGLVDFIRSAILSTLSTRLCGFYKVWASLYNINRRCQNSQTCGLTVPDREVGHLSWDRDFHELKQQIQKFNGLAWWTDILWRLCTIIVILEYVVVVLWIFSPVSHQKEEIPEVGHPWESPF